MNQNLIDEYVARKKEIKRAEALLKELKEELKPIEKQVLGEFESDGIASVKTSDGKTIYLNTQLWASRDPSVSEEVFLASLRENGLEDLIQQKVNSSTLSAAMRELAGDDYLNLDDIRKPYGVRLAERTSVRVLGL